MKYSEENKDLFTVSEDYNLAHCISADFGMGKGIVVEFNKRFDMKRKLQSKISRLSQSAAYKVGKQDGIERLENNIFTPDGVGIIGKLLVCPKCGNLTVVK